jgi:hypothetical protein
LSKHREVPSGDPTGVLTKHRVMYAAGRGVWKDDEEAARWFRLATGEKVESRVGIGR